MEFLYSSLIAITWQQGIMCGVFLGMLVVWALKFMGLFIGEDTLSSTIIARLLEKIGIVSFFLGV